MNMFDAQTWWARDVFMGRTDLANKTKMQANIDDRIAHEDAGTDDYHAIWYQTTYIKELVAETDYPYLICREYVGHSRLGKVTKILL